MFRELCSSEREQIEAKKKVTINNFDNLTLFIPDNFS